MGSWIHGGLLAPGKLPLAAGLMLIGLVVMGCKMVRLGYKLLSSPEYASFSEVVASRLGTEDGLLEHYLTSDIAEPAGGDAQVEVSLIFELYRADSCDLAPVDPCQQSADELVKLALDEYVDIGKFTHIQVAIRASCATVDDEAECSESYERRRTVARWRRALSIEQKEHLKING